MTDKAFRDGVLAGAGRNPRDTPLIRANAARDYFARELAAAKEAEARMEAVLVKALLHLDAATEAEAEAEKQRADLESDLEAAGRLLRDIHAGVDVTEHCAPAPGQAVTVFAGVAEAIGEAKL